MYHYTLLSCPPQFHVVVKGHFRVLAYCEENGNDDCQSHFVSERYLQLYALLYRIASSGISYTESNAKVDYDIHPKQYPFVFLV